MLFLLELGFFMKYWHVIVGAFFIILAIIITIIIVSKRRAKKRAQIIAEQIKQINQYRFVGNTVSRVFHKRDCHVLRGVPDSQRIYFSSCSVADANGYKACGVCKPWY